MRVISCFGRIYYHTEAKAENSVAFGQYASFYPNAPYITSHHITSNDIIPHYTASPDIASCDITSSHHHIISSHRLRQALRLHIVIFTWLYAVYRTLATSHLPYQLRIVEKHRLDLNRDLIRYCGGVRWLHTQSDANPLNSIDESWFIPTLGLLLLSLPQILSLILVVVVVAILQRDVKFVIYLLALSPSKKSTLLLSKVSVPLSVTLALSHTLSFHLSIQLSYVLPSLQISSLHDSILTPSLVLSAISKVWHSCSREPYHLHVHYYYRWWYSNNYPCLTTLVCLVITT